MPNSANPVLLAVQQWTNLSATEMTIATMAGTGLVVLLKSNGSTSRLLASAGSLIRERFLVGINDEEAEEDGEAE